MPSEELQAKWAKLLGLLRQETRQGGITWKPALSRIRDDDAAPTATYMSSSRDLTYVIAKFPDVWDQTYGFEIRDEGGEVVGSIKSDEGQLIDALKDNMRKLWLAISESKSRINEVLDRAIADLDSPF